MINIFAKGPTLSRGSHALGGTGPRHETQVSPAGSDFSWPPPRVAGRILPGRRVRSPATPGGRRLCGRATEAAPVPQSSLWGSGLLRPRGTGIPSRSYCYSSPDRSRGGASWAPGRGRGGGQNSAGLGRATWAPNTHSDFIFILQDLLIFLKISVFREEV